jgi:hypothetical protein
MAEGKAIHRHGDLNTGHGCWPPSAAIASSTRTYVNNILVHLKGDLYETHCCPSIPECHQDVGVGSSSTVYVENKLLRRVDDANTPDGTAAEGSPNTFCG